MFAATLERMLLPWKEMFTKPWVWLELNRGMRMFSPPD